MEAIKEFKEDHTFLCGQSVHEDIVRRTKKALIEEIWETEYRLGISLTSLRLICCTDDGSMIYKNIRKVISELEKDLEQLSQLGAQNV